MTEQPIEDFNDFDPDTLIGEDVTKDDPHEGISDA
jgi:hypothetical protein